MKYHVVIFVLLFSHVVMCMENRGKQLEIAAGRKVYIAQADVHRTAGFCVFCDEETLKSNYTLLCDNDRDVRLILNKNPYFPFDQGHHFVIMPISHEENPDDISKEQLAVQCYEIQKLSAVFYDNSFGQEFFTNWGKIAGQSVPHWHSQFKNYKRKPLSVPEEIAARKNTNIKTIEDAFEDVICAAAKASIFVPALNISTNKRNAQCHCCTIGTTDTEDENSLVVGRFKHNFVCLSHYPTVPGELSVVPYLHVSAMKDLPEESFLENMVIAMALLRKTQEYANHNIRESSGGNIYTKSMGKMKECANYHIHTQVIPRTVIPATPGTLEGHSNKLDYDPVHFFAFAKELIQEISQFIQ